ncbi:MAG: hypothetical protein Q7S58_00635 [Candidatus Binatus sp.]|uniref:hypothetical protein n=1 Tax=Candidatus Binatus sp. TaxID=2811406 RepID=UPI00271CBBAB|nr:hypothetical protein [Candidatus Binatus sp.]MDO8430892.1 hypothetical protein [Candidatus Binatus sp.]
MSAAVENEQWSYAELFGGIALAEGFTCMGETQDRAPRFFEESEGSWIFRIAQFASDKGVASI